MLSVTEVEHWMDLGAFPVTQPNQTPNAVMKLHSSRTMGDEFHSREGKNPDRQLRSRSAG
jgi:hypothetical protein